MKHTNVEWLGEVPEHWYVTRGKNLFTKVDRPVREGDEVVTCFRDGSVTLRKNRRTRGFTESLKEIGYQGIRIGDLVIHAMDVSAGAVGVADSDGKGTPVYAVCEPKSNADAHYHAFVIREMARNQWILSLATGIRERSTDFRFGTYASQRVPLPPLPEQKAIVRYLNYFDRRIRRYMAAKQKLIVLLEEQKQAIIHRAVTRGLDSNVSLKDSGVEWLGKVPERWDVRRLKYCINRFYAGGTPNSVVENFYCVSGEGIPWLLIADMTGKRRIWHTQKAITEAGRASRGLELLPVGTILYSMYASIGTVSILEIDAAVNQAIIGMQPQKEKLDAEYCLYYLEFIRLHIVRLSAASTQANLNAEKVRNLPMFLPPLPEQTAIVEYLDKATATIDTAITRARREIELLNEYRTRLTADVVTGKIDVREAAAGLPDEPETPPDDTLPDELSVAHEEAAQ